MNNSLVQNLSELVSIPSVTRSPEEIKIVGHTYNTLQNIIKENENLSGVKVSIERVDERDDNNIYHGGVICNIQVNKDFKTVWLLWHLDVVPVVKENWDTEPFTLIETGDRFYGRWSCDMKAGVSIMIELLKESLKIQPNKNISLLFTSWEECWIPNGLTEIIKSKRLGGLDFVVALEPTNGSINTGVFWYFDGNFHFHWRSCHSSKPELWENAIHKVWKLIGYLNNPDIIETVEYNWKLLREALSATNIRWWIAANTVPDKCSVQINYRYWPSRNGKKVEEKFREIARDIWANSFETIEHDPSSKIVPTTNPMLIDFIKRTKNNIEKPLELVPFWSDIWQTSELWIPSINFGPGSIEQAHTDNEFLMKDSLHDTWEIFKKYLFN